MNPNLENAKFNKRLIEVYLEQQLDGGGAENDSEQGDSANDAQDQAEAQARLGIASPESSNPGDDADAGSGVGASLNPGDVDLSDPFDGNEQQLKRFLLSAQDDQSPVETEMIEQWIKTLPQASSELYRRKFLRDYQRQNRVER